MNWLRKLCHGDKGQGLVEMALVLPVLLILFMGIFEFGRIFGGYLEISNLAREGARYGAVGQGDTQIEQTLKSECAFLNGNELIVSISPEPVDRIKGSPLEVTVDYSLPLVSPLISDLLPNPFPLTAHCFMRIER
ncbi:MAG TPA: TadE/TadG family type IV pilus assembly protein [Syntrophomonadaceae bacterium]|nr:TadE/TadG family type IV pilus assembly protein [Syntrophomonadaceae bacterium]